MCQKRGSLGSGKDVNYCSCIIYLHEDYRRSQLKLCYCYKLIEMILIKGEHSAIISTFIKLPFVIKIFVLFIFSGRFTQVLLFAISFERVQINQIL